MAATIENIRLKYLPTIDVHQDNFDTIKLEVDRLMEFLNTKRYNILSVSDSLYQLKKIGDRIYRYRTYEHINLTIAECDLLYKYIEDSIMDFLKEPVDNANVYLYNPLDRRWVVVSSKGYLWMIYGNVEKQLRKAGAYLESLMAEAPSLLELKYAMEFSDKLVAQRGYEEEQSIIGKILDCDKFSTVYRRLAKHIKTESLRSQTPLK